MEISEVQAGDVIRFKRYEWDARYSYMIVDVVDSYGFLDGRKWHAGHGVAKSQRAVLAVTSMTIMERVART